MPISISLEADQGRCSRVPLAVLGYCLTQTDFLQPIWEPLQLSMRKRDYAPVDKLQDVMISILAGCRSISAINVRLRPEQALAQAWGRDKFADQSSYSRTLDPLTTLRLYDGRGADEGEIGSDKTGLLLPKRRKHALAAQEALVLLTDV